jgi:hypothetical protein
MNTTKIKVLGIRLTTEEQAALKAKAEAEGLSLSDYARHALRAYEALREAGLYATAR